MFSLQSIQFHGLHLNGNRTIPLRRNQVAGSEFQLPEWRAGVAGLVAPAAYLVGDSNLFVHVELARTDIANPIDVEIRADDVAGGRNLLGAIPSRPVHFNAGDSSASADLPLAGAVLSAVGCHVDQWFWSVQAIDPPGQFPLIETSHPIYTILSPPGPPWQTDSQAPQFWVWTGVLDVACIWAAGATSPSDATDQITRKLHSLGDGALKLKYSKQTSYAKDSPFLFDCAAFLEMLQGNTPDPHVDCLAVSSIVSTLANSVGNLLFQAQTGVDVGVVTQPARVIGATHFVHHQLARHDVAVHNPVTICDPVWDGCLQFVAENGQGIPATDIVFDADGRNDYIGKLWDLDGRPLTPFKDTGGNMVNRSVMPDSRIPRLASFLPLVKQRLGDEAFNALMDEASIRAPLFVSDFFWTQNDLSGLTLRNTAEFDEPFKRAESLWASNDDEPLTVILYEGSSRDEAKEIFAARLSEYTGPVVYVENAGEVAFKDLDGSYAVAMAGNSVWTAKSTDGIDLAVDISFTQIDRWIQPIGAKLDFLQRDFEAPVPIPIPPPDSPEHVWRLIEAVNGRITRTPQGLMYSQTADGPRAVKLRTLKNANEFKDVTIPL